MGFWERNKPKDFRIQEPAIEPEKEDDDDDEEQPEYRVIHAQDPGDLEKQINEIAEQGYEVYEFAQSQGSSTVTVNYTVIMKEE